MKKEQFRQFLAERLTVAALEIFSAVEKTWDGYQEEICRFKEENSRLQRLLDNVNLIPKNITQHCVSEPPNIKVEPELWTIPDTEQDSDFTDSPLPFPHLSKDCDQQDSSLVSIVYQPRTVQNRIGPDPFLPVPTASTDLVKAEAYGEPACESQPFSTVTPEYSTPQSVEKESLRLPSELHTRISEKAQISVTQAASGNIYSMNRPVECLLEKKKTVNITFCSKRYNTGSKLQINAQSHAGGLHHQCQKCGKLCETKYSLNGHMRTHTDNFIQQSVLKSHLNSHTGGKPYQCQECGKSFGRNGSLKDHLRIHTGLKPYQCQECGKSFGRKGSLKDHLRTHTGQKPYHCQKCGKAFCRKIDLNLHSRKHVNEAPLPSVEIAL
ncbi:zinc finger protein 200-like [Hypomesus transpacificus]|uniref:zinc finger protein 200-like n=1 Tax=Hypomesus transpacificus TaxID=137520 RepID=UPI001F0819C0|nr:zinc finger protein 200-like [Hypomesus transpacificus]